MASNRGLERGTAAKHANLVLQASDNITARAAKATVPPTQTAPFANCQLPIATCYHACGP
jgi:hypothetical protein